MSDGFRNTAPTDAVTVIGNNLGVTVPLPLNASAFGIDNFNSIEVAVFATGQVGTGLLGIVQLQFLWFAPDATTLIWSDTFEVNFDTVNGYLGKRAFIRTPVRAPVLQVVTDSGTAPPTNPTIRIDVLGLSSEVPRVICWQDAETFRASDLLIIGRSGGAIASAGSSGQFNSGLASGGVMVMFTVAFTTGGAGGAGVARLRTVFGSTGIGWPDLVINQGGTTNPLGISSFFTGYIPRRPVGFTVADISGGGTHDTINSWQFAVVRDEP